MASGNDVYCLCFRIFILSCCAWSVAVHWRPSPWVVVVTQLVTQAAFFDGILPSGLSLSAQPLSVGDCHRCSAVSSKVSATSSSMAATDAPSARTTCKQICFSRTILLGQD